MNISHSSSNLSKEVVDDLNGVNGRMGRLRIYGFATVISIFYLARRPDNGEYRFDETISLIFNLSTPLSKKQSFTRTAELLEKLHKLEDLEPVLESSSLQIGQFSWNQEYIVKVYQLLADYKHPFVSSIGNRVKPEDLCTYYKFEFQRYYKGQMSAMAWIWLHTMSFFVEFRIRQPLTLAITRDFEDEGAGATTANAQFRARQSFRTDVVKSVGLFILCGFCQDHFFTFMLMRRGKDNQLISDEDYSTILSERFIQLHEIIQANELTASVSDSSKLAQREKWFQTWFNFSENIYNY